MMVISTVVPYNDFDPVAKLAQYFKDKNALKAEDAIKVDHIDWLSLSSTFSDESRLLKLYPFIKKTDSGKFWFDTSAYTERRKYLEHKGKKILVGIGIGLFLLIFSMVVISLIINR